MADWSDLPTDVAALIAKRFTYVEDFLAFASVCKSWRIGTTLMEKRTFNPWCMLLNLDWEWILKDKTSNGMRRCISICNQKVVDVAFPDLAGTRCWGTQYGWLFTFGLDMNISLFNPLTKTHISLPPQTTFRQLQASIVIQSNFRGFIRKFALSTSPSDPNLVVMAVYGSRELAFAFPGDESWTSFKYQQLIPYEDVVFFRDHFYAITRDGTLVVCDVITRATAASKTEPEVRDVAPRPADTYPSDAFYLVDISGDLHLVALRLRGGPKYLDYHQVRHIFLVFKFNFVQANWNKVDDNLGGHALFLGNNTTFAISTSNYPECKSDCIYFTTDVSSAAYDNHRYWKMGVYDFKKNILLDPPYKGEDVRHDGCLPFFFLPTLSS